MLKLSYLLLSLLSNKPVEARVRMWRDQKAALTCTCCVALVSIQYVAPFAKTPSNVANTSNTRSESWAAGISPLMIMHVFIICLWYSKYLYLVCNNQSLTTVVLKWEGKEWTWTINVPWNIICMLNREVYVSQPCSQKPCTASAPRRQCRHVQRNTETLAAPMCLLAGSLRVRPVWMSVNKLALQLEFKLAVLLKRDSTGNVKLHGPVMSGPCGSGSQKKDVQQTFLH